MYPSVYGEGGLSVEKTKNGLDHFFKYFNLVYQIGATLALILLVVTCALQVASRYITFVRILGMEELARLGFVWMVSLSLSLCAAYKSHLSIDIFSSKVSEKMRPYFDIFIDLIVLFYLVILFYYSIIKCGKVADQVTIVFLIKLKYLYSALIIGSGGAILNMLYQIFGNICTVAARKKKKEVTE